MRPLRANHIPVSYNLDDAAAAVGVSRSLIDDAVSKGLLAKHFLGPKKPVILHDDLHAWVANAPLERP